MSDFFDRLDIFMKIKQYNDNSFSKFVGLSKGVIGKARVRKGISQENVAKVLHAFPDLNANWWFRGDGNMILDGTEKNESISFSEKIMKSQSELLDFKDQQIENLKSENLKLKTLLKERS